MTNIKTYVFEQGTQFHVHEGKVTKIGGQPIADPTLDEIIINNAAGRQIMRLSNDGTVIDSLVEPTLNAHTCPERKYHGNPFRYCPTCTWIEEDGPQTEQEFLGNSVPMPTPKENIVKPSLGRVVHYRLTANDAQAINIRRDDWSRYNILNGPQSVGYQAHVGNRVSEGDVFAADIVRVWGDHEGAHVNLQVKLDGNDTFWATSIVEGEDNGNYFWPPRV